jgi:hypothetical protein
MSDNPFDAEACDIGGQASATNGLSDMKTPSKTHCVIDPFNPQLTPYLKMDNINIEIILSKSITQPAQVN